MSERSTKLAAATLAAAALSKTDIADGADASKEIMRIYRTTLQRLERFHADRGNLKPEG
jgi:hypothetical protein